jgi:hypothetical protein
MLKSFPSTLFCFAYFSPSFFFFLSLTILSTPLKNGQKKIQRKKEKEEGKEKENEELQSKYNLII